ncbi:hypothetical protein [Peptoniphilus gorbachii]|uniref:Tripartite tricarboxylate transporter TctB family protein n=1 Tax=Peptoniphilus gorbachii TaxID=411567 RepID=A0A6N3BVS1_9FIRM
MYRKKEFASIIFLFVVSIFFFLGAKGMEGDSGLFPKILSGLIFVLTCVELGEVLTNRIKESKKKEERSPRKLMYIIVLSILYVVLIKPLGFVISTFLFLAASMKLLEVKNKKLAVLVPFITAAIIYVVFKILLKVQIPVGILGF